ncbi:MAG: hypothetical protein M3R36_13660 [Bacteroidota bacterium]|nr:hypothetical protein [Bacteroidota bacterium]
MEKTFQIINQLKEAGIIKDYAVAGAVASIFYIEPITTYDLDIMIVLKEESDSLISLSPIYDWFGKKGFKFDKEHIIIEGVPVQFIPVYNELVNEAISNSLEKKFANTLIKVIGPEYLIAIMVQTFRQKDKERIIRFIEESEINNELINEILKKYNLSDKYKSINN